MLRCELDAITIDHAYTLPMETCTNAPATGISQRLKLSGSWIVMAFFERMCGQVPAAIDGGGASAGVAMGFDVPMLFLLALAHR